MSISILYKSWFRRIALALFLAALGCGDVRAEFVVKGVRVDLVKQELQVSADVELNLSEQAQLAIDNGVPLVVLTEFQLVRDGTVWNDVLASRQSGARLRYHSLSGRYVVEGLERGDVATYPTVSSALKRMGTLRSIVVEVPNAISAELPRLKLAVRSRIDINALPAPLRPLALFSADWSLSSEWTAWQINQ